MTFKSERQLHTKFYSVGQYQKETKNVYVHKINDTYVTSVICEQLKSEHKFFSQKLEEFFECYTNDLEEAIELSGMRES